MTLLWQKDSKVQNASEPLDPDDAWDTIEYAPLSDADDPVKHGQKENFIVKLLEEKGTSENMVVIRCVDEGKLVKDIAVHIAYKDILLADRFYVIHRAMILDTHITVDPYAMITAAPRSYIWS